VIFEIMIVQWTRWNEHDTGSFRNGSDIKFLP
jgi:hypothetical protein